MKDVLDALVARIGVGLLLGFDLLLLHKWFVKRCMFSRLLLLLLGKSALSFFLPRTPK